MLETYVPISVIAAFKEWKVLFLSRVPVPLGVWMFPVVMGRSDHEHFTSSDYHRNSHLYNVCIFHLHKHFHDSSPISHHLAEADVISANTPHFQEVLKVLAIGGVYVRILNECSLNKHLIITPLFSAQD
jgi:hypothetical protein